MEKKVFDLYNGCLCCIEYSYKTPEIPPYLYEKIRRCEDGWRESVLAELKDLYPEGRIKIEPQLNRFS